MTRSLIPLCLCSLLALSACANLPFGLSNGASARSADATQTRPQARPAKKPPVNARTADAFDTVSAAERSTAAQVPASGGEARLGLTVASLGDPSQTGLWLKTPLVDAPRKGRVVYPGTGKSAQVDLIPLDAAPGSGSQLSLSAMRLIEAPLTGLPEIEVFGS